MGRNENPWVRKLLSWHGHDRGGVRVPFHPTMGRPLADVLETPLLSRIEQLAFDLIEGTPGTPRWIFLVGGPGNGKSEAVESFIEALDNAADSGGLLARLVKQSFRRETIAPRCVRIAQRDLEGTVLEDSVRALTVIQDASAVDTPDQMAEDVLIGELAELITAPTGEEPIFICCANRGLIARARTAIRQREAYEWLDVSEVTELLTQLLTATGLGPDALAIDRSQCWPLEMDPRFAAWPLDLDSIIAANGDTSPFGHMLSKAVDEKEWRGQGSCTDCSSRDLCPFLTNAEMLRDTDIQHSLLKLLRHSEFATGQRWNFRDCYSLCAEIIVGQRDDFETKGTGDSPCQWVHILADEIRYGEQPTQQLAAAWELTFHLYSQALFPEWLDPITDIPDTQVGRSELTRVAFESIRRRQRSNGTQIRSALSGTFSTRLDPALATPTNSDALIRLVEDEFGQSVRQGYETLSPELSPVISVLMELMAKAEEDWTDLVVESRGDTKIRESLRVISSTLCKRYLGARDGEYLHQKELDQYESMLNNQNLLRELVPTLRSILAPENVFGASLIQVFGQPPTEASRDVIVSHSLGGIVTRGAVESTRERPGHDIPWLEVRGHHIPITFDLFESLRSHAAGAMLASFAPHARAALDKVSNAIGGKSARDSEAMLGGDVTIYIGSLGELRHDVDGAIRFTRNSQ